MNIVILGGPGSGKKTQTGLLAEAYQLTVVTASELVKQAMAEESELGSQIRLRQQSNQPVSDDIILSLLQQRLTQPDQGGGFILDGFPRNLLQALTLDELFSEMEISLDFVLLFEIETDALMERLVGRRTCRSCGAVYNVYTQPAVVDDVCDLCGGRLHQRADDTEEAVSSRLHVFDHLTAPLLSHYGKQGKLLRVDGEGEVAEVFRLTRQAIDRFLAERTEAEVQITPSNPRPATGELNEAPGPADSPDSAGTAGGSVATDRVKKKPAKVNTQNSTAKPKRAKKALPVRKKGVAKQKDTAKTGKSAAALAKSGKTSKKAPSKGSHAGKKRAKGLSAKKTVEKRVAVTKAAAKKGGVKKVVKKKSQAKASAAKRPTGAKARKAAPKKAQVKKAQVKKAQVKKPAAKKRSVIKPARQRSTTRPGVRKKSVGGSKKAKKQ